MSRPDANRIEARTQTSCLRKHSDRMGNPVDLPLLIKPCNCDYFLPQWFCNCRAHGSEQVRRRRKVTSQNAAKIQCLMLFSGQDPFALEPFPRDSQVRPAIDLAMG